MQYLATGQNKQIRLHVLYPRRVEWIESIAFTGRERQR